MQRRTNIQVSSLIILLSIITIIVQFLVYYLFAAFYVVCGISCLVLFLCCHILLEQSVTYEACYNFSLLNLFISCVIILLSYLGNGQSVLPYSSTMLGIAVINWLIPFLHCFLRYLFDYGTKVENYNIFYRKDSILFAIFYLGIILYGSFAQAAFPWAYQFVPEAVFLPFDIIAAQIENYLYGFIPLSDIIIYLTSRILPFLPYGFYITLILRKQARLPRFFALLMLPFLLEFLQYFIIPYRCDIDDILYALIGGLLGSLTYYLVNFLFRLITGKNFLMKDTGSSYSGNDLHF